MLNMCSFSFKKRGREVKKERRGSQREQTNCYLTLPFDYEQYFNLISLITASELFSFPSSVDIDMLEISERLTLKTILRMSSSTTTSLKVKGEVRRGN